jgi:hypothetical protein
MLPLLRMLEFNKLSLSDAEARGFRRLGEAAKRCGQCLERTACIRWLKWHGRYGPTPVCLNAAYLAELQQRQGRP